MKRIIFLIPAVALAVLLAPSATAQERTIALPDNFTPEGIASGIGSTFYAGSIESAEVYRGSYETGRGSVLVSSRTGRNHIGLKYERRSKLLFVAGGPSNGTYVYDARTGEDVRSYEFPDAGFINDVVITKRAAYATDSQVQRFYRIPLNRRGRPGDAEVVPITGDFVYGTGFNANGIEAATGGRKLIMVKSSSGELFKVDAATGFSRRIELDAPVTAGDGLLLRGRRLYVVQNQLEQIAVVKLSRKLRSGRVDRVIRKEAFDVPTTIAPYRQWIYAVNARFPPNGDDRNPEEDVVRAR